MTELKSFIEQNSIEIVLITEKQAGELCSKLDGYSKMTLQRFGANDYLDHRNDSLSQLSKLVLSMPANTFQEQQLTKFGKPATKLAVFGCFSGYSAILIP